MVKIADLVADEPRIEGELPPIDEPEVVERRGIDVMGILKTETGEGEIDDYITHPLNFNGSKGMAQVIRGITGFAGNIRLAIVDIIVGVIRLGQERKRKEVAANVQAIDPARQ